MAKSNLPHSIRKFLRREKARIRREALDTAEAERRIEELVVKKVKEYSGIIADKKQESRSKN